MAKRISRRARTTAQQKVNPAYRSMVQWSDTPKPVTMARNYASFAREGYARNDTVYKVIAYIAQNGAAIPPVLYTDETHETIIDKHPMLDLLKRPNPEQTGVDLREALISYFLISGNAYLYLINGVKNTPAELWALEPSKTKVVPSPTRGIVGYQYDDMAEQIPAKQIGRMKSWNPNDPYYGMSAMEVAAVHIDTQKATREWNLALVQNMGKTSGVFVADGVMNKNERDQAEARLAQKMKGGKVGNPVFLDGGVKYQQTSVAPSEMDWLKSQQYNSNVIANLWNIAPQLVGDTAATTYQNMQQAKAASYTEAIFPILDKLYAMLTAWLVAMYPDIAQNGCLYYDKTTVEVIQDLIQAQKDAEADRAIKAYAVGACMLNQALQAQGYEDIGPDGDVFKVGAVLVPKDKIAEYAEQSLAEPAAPPTPQPEPLSDDSVPNAPGTSPAPPTANNAADVSPKPTETPAPAEPSPATAKTLRMLRKDANDPTHVLWECGPDPCTDCAQNDGVLIEIGDTFPNGCTSPDDCHPNCQCQAHLLSIPDGTNVSGLALAAVVGMFAVGIILSRRARDAAARAQQEADEDEDEIEAEDENDSSDDDLDDDDDAQPQFAAHTSRGKPKAQRRAQRAAFRRFKEAAGL